MYDDYMSIFKRKGQVALVVVLVVLVGLTIGVAILGRSVTNVGISNQEEERARSFSAAEAGVEDALRQDLSILAGSGGNFNVGDSSVSYKVSKLTNVTSEINPGEVVTVDWSKSGASSFSVAWTGSTCSPNLVATTISPTGVVVHSSPSTPATFPKGSGGLVRMRFAVEFVGCRTNVTINGTGGDLSFFQVDSVGISGEANSKVEVVRSAPAASGLLDFAVFSGGDIN